MLGFEILKFTMHPGKGPLAISSGTSFGIGRKIAEVASFVDHQNSWKVAEN